LKKDDSINVIIVWLWLYNYFVLRQWNRAKNNRGRRKKISSHQKCRT